MDSIVLQTSRLMMRKLHNDDLRHLQGVLGDPNVMYAWEHAFTDQEIENWLAESLMRYERDGFSYYAVIRRDDGAFIGVSGLLMEEAAGEPHVGIGYILAQEHWHQGYALECATACIDCAHSLGISHVTAQIRPENTASRKVAEKLGMEIEKTFIRFYRGKEMPHLLYGKTL